MAKLTWLIRTYLLSLLEMVKIIVLACVQNVCIRAATRRDVAINTRDRFL